MQYTIRDIPARLDKVLRDRARAEGKSLNEVAIEAMSEGAGVRGEPEPNYDLDFICGTWVEDPEFDKIIAEMDRIDPEKWK